MAPLARVELIVPVQEDSTAVVTAATLLADRGAKVSSSALMDRLNLPKATDEADALQGASKAGTSNLGRPTSNAEVKKVDVANAMDHVALSEWLHELRSALAKDLQPLGDALMGAIQAGDLAAMQAALKKISSGMPELAGDAANLAEVLAGQFADAWLGDGAEEVENVERGNPVAYFYANGIRRPIYASATGTPMSASGQSIPLSISKQAGSINAAISAAVAKQQGASFSMGRVDDALAKRILEATDAHGDPRDVTGMEWRIDSDFVAHARRFHPNLTDDDFRQIPVIIAKAPIIEPSTNDRGFSTVNFRMKRSKREYLLVSVQFDKKRHLSLNTFKKSAEGKTL